MNHWEYEYAPGKFRRVTTVKKRKPAKRVRKAKPAKGTK